MSPEEKEKKLKEILDNPVLQAKVLDTIWGNKPEHYSKTSVCSYYKEKYGKQLQVVFDEMMRTKEPQVFGWKHFGIEHGLNRKSLYQRVNSSIKFLIDKLDPDGKYAAFKATLNIENSERHKGLLIEINPKYLDGETNNFIPRSITPDKDKPKWWADMATFVEEGEVGQKFIKEKLALTDEEVVAIKAAVDVPDVISNITNEKIILHKIAV